MNKPYNEMSISEIAGVIRKNWKPINYAAKPYVDGMAELDSIEDKVISDDGRNIVAYFLCNAGQFKGDVARAVKAELRKRLAS